MELKGVIFGTHLLGKDADLSISFDSLFPLFAPVNPFSFQDLEWAFFLGLRPAVSK